MEAEGSPDGKTLDITEAVDKGANIGKWAKADLSSCSNVKVENIPNELGDLAKAVSTQSVESTVC